MKKVLAFLLLITFTLAQASITSLPDVFPSQDSKQIFENYDQLDPMFLLSIQNYFGCKTWENGICIECSDRFYFN